jgi:phosphoribosyl 1,2-cyclic phosphodiesterase
VHPLLCFGFRIRDALLYISDVSHIPDDVWPILLTPPPAVLALDCLSLHPHSSHFGLGQTVEAARRIGAKRTYMLGFGHEVSHEEYVTIGETAGGREITDQEQLSAHENVGMDIVAGREPIWLRPAYDGLRVGITSDGQVSDEGYE